MRTLLIYCLATILLTLSASAQPAANPDYDKAIATVSAWIENEIEKQNYVGLAVGFAHKDFIWTEGFGHANLELDVPMTAESVHRLASVSKPITSVGILKLVQDGVISLDDDVRTYVPDFPEKRWPVTIRRLLGHQAGISHYKNYREEAFTVERFTSAEALAIFKDWELLFEPGTDHSYTSYGYNLLAFVIEGATGRTFRDYMTEEVWLPMGMTHTRTDDVFDVIPNRVAGYERVNGEIQNCRPVTTTMKFGGGGMVSTVGDLINFARGLDKGTVLSPAWCDTMWTPMAMTTGTRANYAMGWSTDNVTGFHEVWHTGGQEGTSTCIIHIPSLEFTAVVIGNLANGSPWAPCQQMFEAVMQQAYSFPSFYSGADLTGKKLGHLEQLVRSGSARYDLYGRALTSNGDSLTAAFAAINTALALDDADSLAAFFESAAHPSGGDYLQIAGTHIAASLREANGEDYFIDAMPYRRLKVMLDYQARAANSSSIPSHYRFSEQVETMVRTALEDWNEIWTPELAAIEFESDPIDVSFATKLAKVFRNRSAVPDLSRRISRRAEAEFDAGRPDEAVRLAELNTELYPEIRQVWLDRGFAIIASGGAVAKGQEMIRKGYAMGRLTPDGHEILNGRAYGFANAGNPTGAIALLDVAIELYPQVANIKDSKAEMFLMMGDTTSAITWYQKAIETDPEFENAKRMLEQLGATPAVDPTAGTN